MQSPDIGKNPDDVFLRMADIFCKFSICKVCDDLSIKIYRYMELESNSECLSKYVSVKRYRNYSRLHCFYGIWNFCLS